MNRSTSRRKFMKTLSAAPFLLGSSPAWAADPLFHDRKFSPNDNIRVAALGMGIIGFYNMQSVAALPGVEFVAAADCYDGRLQRSREMFGEALITTRDYQEILSRDDIDAVIVNTPDHWHARMAIEAMEAGKAVHIEKPMVQKIDDGHRIIEAQSATGQVVQVGSEGFQSPLHQKAKELLKLGAIGRLNAIESDVSRNNGIGAWQYSIPSDASPQTIDWNRFLGPAPRRPFDADRFFRWRKYWDYGTGVAGDMFVHRLSALHYMLDSKGPVQVMATGGIRYWNDGREAPDVIIALLDYPETATHPAFTLTLKANFADGSGGGPAHRLIGSEGVLEIRGDTLTVRHQPRWDPSAESLMEGYNSVFTFAEPQREAFAEEFRQYRPQRPHLDSYEYGYATEYKTPEGYDNNHVHFLNFFDAIRNGRSIEQTPEYGLRAAAPALLANHCYRDRKAYGWDPEAMKVV